MEKPKKDFLSLYRNFKELIIDLQNMSNFIDYKSISLSGSLTDTKNFEQLFTACHSAVSFLLPEDCKDFSLKNNYPKLYDIVFLACMTTSLCTIEELLTSRKVISVQNAYRNIPDKIPYDKYEKYLLPTEKEIGKLAEYIITENELTKDPENTELHPTERNDWAEIDIKNKLKKNKNFSKSRKPSLLEDIEKLNYYLPNNNTLIAEKFCNIVKKNYLHHTGLNFSLFLLRQNNVTKDSFLQLEHKLVKMKLFLQRLESKEQTTNGYKLSKEDIKEAKACLKSFLVQLKKLYNASYFYKDTYNEYYSADTIFTLQKRTLLFAHDILDALFEHAGTPSLLFEKKVTSYFTETISVPFSRHTIINTFHGENGLINICAFEDFFKGYYPTLVRLFLFAILGFPDSVNTLEHQLENTKENLLHYLRTKHRELSTNINYSESSAYTLSILQEETFTKKINALSKIPQPTNELIEKFRMQRRPILSSKKTAIEAPSNNALIKFMTAICELYSTCPAQVIPHPIIDYSAPMDNYFSLLQQAKVDIPNNTADMLAYNQTIFYSLCQLNIKNCHLLFNDSLWIKYLNKFDTRKEKFIAIMDMGVFINPNISYNAAQNIENIRLRQLVYDYMQATIEYSSLHNDILRQFDISTRESLPMRLTINQHELVSIINSPYYTIEEPTDTNTTRLGT